MAESFVQLPNDGPGKKLRTFDAVVGANTVQHQAFVPVNSAGVEGEATVRTYGAAQPTVSGSITSAASVVDGTTDITKAANCTVVVSGTYAGVNAAFEVTADGSNWVAIQGQRLDSGIAESVTGILPSNTIRAWTISLAGVTRLRVRATAWTSGTCAVMMDYGSAPFQPVVSVVNTKPQFARMTLSTAATGLTAGTSGTHALAVLAQAWRDTTQLGGGTGTSFALTAGRTFRVQSFSIAIQAKAATVTGLVANLLYNPSGAVTTSSPVIAQLACGAPSAVINSTGTAFLAIGYDGIDLPAGLTPGQVGVSIIPSWTTTAANVSISVLGYEL